MMLSITIQMAQMKLYEKSGQDNSDFSTMYDELFINHLLITTMMKLTQINLLLSLKLHYLTYLY